MTVVRAGARAPFCYGMAATRRFYSFEGQAGRAAAVIVADGIPEPDLRLLIDDFARKSDDFAGWDTDVIVLGNEDAVRALVEWVPASSGIQLIDCSSGVLAEHAIVFVMDRNLRVALRIPATLGAATACLRCVAELPRESPRDVVQSAPVLMLPNLLPRAMCESMIERFENGASIDGGIATIDAAGMPCSRIDHEKKNRRDLLIAADDELHDLLRTILLDRCAPEIAKAFHAKVTHIDRLLIARYDAPAGWFRRHRDNRGKNVAFREFAISVNLNTEAYAGGHLTFPEYNDHLYSPPTGGGIIFSSALLHEAAAVTQGRRYVLLTFLHGDAAELRRQAYEQEYARLEQSYARSLSVTP